MKKTKRTALNATALTLIASTAFTNDVVSEPYSINWDLIIKDPVMTASEPPTLPTVIGDRISVSTSESEFNSVGRILKNGRNHCTGNIVTIDGYSTSGEGVLVSTAAHCLDEGIKAEDITFAIDFINANDVVEVHTFDNPLMWFNPNYNEDDTARKAYDQALMFFPYQETPAEVIPSELQIFSAHIMHDFGNAEFRDNIVTSAGYSQDMNGLSIERDCQVINASLITGTLYPYIKTDCSLNNGASGSGLISDIREDGQLVISAITSTKSKSIEVADENFRSHFALMYHHNLAQVPFLMKDEICARVTARSGLNIRSYNYNDEGSELLAIPIGDIVYVTDMLYDEQEKYESKNVWLEVTLPQNVDSTYPTGYSNSAYLEEAPCPSR